MVKRSEEHTSELQSRRELVCRLLLEKKNTTTRAGADSVCPPLPLGVPGYSCTLVEEIPGPYLPVRLAFGVGVRDLQGLFFFNDTATTEIYTLSLHDALPI